MKTALPSAFTQRVIETLQKGESLPAEWARELFPPEKREYELVYQNKAREEDVLADSMAIPLQPVSSYGKDAHWDNKLIFGDNLQSMKTLLTMKEQGLLVNQDGTPGFRLIYIDPPFATKQEFSGSQDQKAYQDKIAGAAFVEFLRKRLIFMKHLLADNGSLYVHLDTRKSHYMKVLLDEVFGEKNFKCEVVWYYRKFQMRAMGTFTNNSERILWYVKNPASYVYNPLAMPLDKPKYLKRKAWDKDLARIVNVRDDSGSLIYDEYNDQKIDDVWDIPFMGATSPERLGYPTQKPETVLDFVIRSATGEGDLVLDAFAGSGTTLAVAEKHRRRWVGIDSGKLAIYTIQKRFLNLKEGIGNNGLALKPKPFTLFNAGLYDFSRLRQLPWVDWRFFALQLFGCTDEPHTIGGLKLDGKLRGSSVLVFDHIKHPGQRIDEDTIADIHKAVGNRIGRKFFIVAPRGVFDFQQDFIDVGSVRYYALRIPYSFINELHNREFMALTQPAGSSEVNAVVESVGFDFIEPPEVKWSILPSTGSGKLIHRASLHISSFTSKAIPKKNTTQPLGFEALSMVMLDLDYNGTIFKMDEVFYAKELEAHGWTAAFDPERLGSSMMVVFLDIYGNEAREVIATASLPAKLQPSAPKLSSTPKKTSTKKAKKESK